jgi:hypothetical protein
MAILVYRLGKVIRERHRCSLHNNHYSISSHHVVKMAKVVH